jgi:hypothetical protein
MLKKNYVVIMLLAFLCSSNVLKAEEPIDKFLGRWALHLPGGAGWLEVSNDNGYLEADILWYGGSVTPSDHAYIDGETLIVSRLRKMVRQKGRNGNPDKVQTSSELIKFELYGDKLAGKKIVPARDGNGVKTTTFIGNKIPDLPEAPDLSKVKYGKTIKLINGKDLTGWELMGENKTNGWSIVKGALVNNPVQKHGERHVRYGNLKTTAEFEDFKLKLQVNVPKGSNSGIYLRGIYEVQVFDSYGKELDSHNMGALYSRITPSVAAEKPAGEWQDMEITLCDRHLTVILNGKTIIDNQQVLGVTGGAMTACEFKPGPIYLQGDHGEINYRKMELTPIVK